jgi:hypothetical protein
VFDETGQNEEVGTDVATLAGQSNIVHASGASNVVFDLHTLGGPMLGATYVLGDVQQHLGSTLELLHGWPLQAAPSNNSNDPPTPMPRDTSLRVRAWDWAGALAYFLFPLFDSSRHKVYPPPPHAIFVARECIRNAPRFIPRNSNCTRCRRLPLRRNVGN